MPTLELRRKIPRWALPLQRPARYKGASGGRGSGKSHFFAEEAVERMARDPNARVLCAREIQQSLKFSAKFLVESKIRALGMEALFDIQASEIRRVGGQGVMVFVGLQDHTVESIKSFEGFVIAWVEEAHAISQRSLDMLLPTIRLEGSEIWFSWNPDQPTDAVDKFFKGNPPGSIHVRVNYLDNPFLPAVLRTEAERLRVADPDAYEHIWMGGYFLGGHGRIYSSFANRPYPAGNIDETIVDHGGELLIGMDFNVNPMSAVVAIRAADECLILEAIELMTSNTDEMATLLREKYGEWRDSWGAPIARQLVVCPDPAGKQRRTSAPIGQTDHTILEKAGFEVRAPDAAPAVVDRYNNTNEMFLSALEPRGRRRCRILPGKPTEPLVTALANLVYKEGFNRPDARSPFVHITDALGYLLWEEFNVLAPDDNWGVSRY